VILLSYVVVCVTLLVEDAACESVVLMIDRVEEKCLETEKETQTEKDRQTRTDTDRRTGLWLSVLSSSSHKQFHERGVLCCGENLITVETGETARKNFIWCRCGVRVACDGRLAAVDGRMMAARGGRER